MKCRVFTVGPAGVDTVTQMDGGTQQNSALVEQAAAASQSQRMQAKGLRTLVDRFSTAV